MAKIYWRTIKRGARKFSAVPENLKEEIIELAKVDVKANVITAEDFADLIGVEYTE